MRELNMLKNKLYILLLSVFFSAIACAESAVIVKGYAVDNIGIYDEEGSWVRDIATKKLPAPTTATAYDPELGLVRITVAGEQLWLDTMDLKLNKKPRVAWSCADISSSSQSADSTAGGVMGFGDLCKQ